jgi:hypothetical protein
MQFWVKEKENLHTTKKKETNSTMPATVCSNIIKISVADLEKLITNTGSGVFDN